MPGQKTKPAIVPVHCKDKSFDTAPPQDHPCSMPRGSRIAVVSDPGRGKSSLIQNQICRSAPWAAVYVIHGMAESQEYDLIDHTKLTMEQATPEFWAAESKKHGKAPLALVIDDYDYASMNKVEKACCYKVCQHACTHHNVTAWLVSHSLTQLVPRVRRVISCVYGHLRPVATIRFRTSPGHSELTARCSRKPLTSVFRAASTVSCAFTRIRRKEGRG